MRSVAPLLLAALALVGGWWLRAADARGLDAASACRLRLTELTLASGAAPASDRYLAFPDGAPLPWPVLVHGATAALARVALAEPGGDPALGGVDARQLAALVARLTPLLGALAALFALTSLRRLPGVPFGAAALGAALYAFLPQVAGAEGASRFTAQPWVAGLCFLQLGLLPSALRARELTDVTLAALLGGLCGGLAMLADAGALLFVACAAGVLAWQGWLRGGDGRRDAWRAALLYAATAAAVTILPPTEDGPRLAALLPPLAGRSMVAGWAWIWLAWVAFPLAWLALLPRAREPERVFLLLLGVAALVAGSFDARFSAVFVVALTAVLALAVAECFERGGARGGALALLLIAPAFAPLAWPRGEDPAADAAFERGLRWMRDQTSSPGPFNHPDARPDWCVLTAPAAGGRVVYHARRPVVAAGFDGVTDERARAAARALLAATPDELGRALDELGARYVVVSPTMLDDPAVLEQGARSKGALHRLALPPENAAADHYAGLELVYASSLWIEPGGPAIAIYRREPGPRAPARASIRR